MRIFVVVSAGIHFVSASLFGVVLWAFSGPIERGLFTATEWADETVVMAVAFAAAALALLQFGLSLAPRTLVLVPLGLLAAIDVALLLQSGSALGVLFLMLQVFATATVWPLISTRRRRGPTM